MLISCLQHLPSHSMSASKLGVEVGSHNLYEDDPDQVRGSPPVIQIYFVLLPAQPYLVSSDHVKYVKETKNVYVDTLANCCSFTTPVHYADEQMMLGTK